MNKTLDFCLVGAPKCGTTSLYNYLKPHPEVFLPKVKEPHYYCTDFPGYRRMTTDREYESIFARSRPGQKLGEASVFYLYSKDAIRNMIQEHPACKVVAILRRPVEMLQSYHQQLTNGFRETELDFEKAWQLRHERGLGKNIPVNCLEASHLQYGEVARFGDQIERIHQFVPERQVLVLFHEDLKTDTRGTYVKLLDFLELSHDGRQHFPRFNESKAHRSRLISRLLMRPPYPLNHAKQWIKKQFNCHRSLLRPLYYGVLYRKEEKQPLSDAFVQSVMQAHEDDIRKLQSITGRDLSHWLVSRKQKVA